MENQGGKIPHAVGDKLTVAFFDCKLFARQALLFFMAIIVG
jgi:hypothetical protein